MGNRLQQQEARAYSIIGLCLITHCQMEMFCTAGLSSSISLMNSEDVGAFSLVGL